MDFLCFSHLRWDFVYQRPQHLLSRFAQSDRVFYVEEPDFESGQDRYVLSPTKDKVTVVKLKLSDDASLGDVSERQKRLVDSLMRDEKISEYVLWYYTPMALQISDHLKPRLTVFDCMDELSAFKFAPPMLATEDGVSALVKLPSARDFITDAYAHYKFVAYTAPVKNLFKKVGLPDVLDNGFVQLGGKGGATAFIESCRALRFWERADAA